jgi:hypothetical protein
MTTPTTPTGESPTDLCINNFDAIEAERLKNVAALREAVVEGAALRCATEPGS